MKKLSVYLFTFIVFCLSSCEKGYDDEIFIEKYRAIYGKWGYVYTVGESGYIKNEYHIIEFIHYGQFRYNNGRIGKIKIVEQNENSLYLDFNTLFPAVENAYVGLFSFSNDSLMITPAFGLPSLYIRK